MSEVKKFLYENQEYKSIRLVSDELEISISNLRKIIYKSDKERGTQYKFIVENFEILDKLKVFDDKLNKYIPVLKYDRQTYIFKYKEQSQRRGNSVVQYKFRFEGEELNGIEALWSKIHPILGKDLSGRTFRKLITHQESTYSIKKEETLDLLSTVEIYDISIGDWRSLIDRKKIFLIGQRRPVQKRVDNRFDKFLITKGIFTDNYDRDRINNLINLAIKKKDYYEFSVLIHDVMINLLGGSFDVFGEPEYEKEPDDYAFYTVEACYERLIDSNLDIPKDWIKFLRYRTKRRILDIFRKENSFEESHEIDYRNKSSVLDYELYLEIRRLSGLGIITSNIEESFPMKEIVLSELVDYLLINFCLFKEEIDVLRIFLIESIKNNKLYKKGLNKKYINTLVYLFNQYKLLTEIS